MLLGGGVLTTGQSGLSCQVCEARVGPAGWVREGLEVPCWEVGPAGAGAAEGWLGPVGPPAVVDKMQ